MIFQTLENGTLQFVGDFERLYETDPDPWGQSAEGGSIRAPYYRWSRVNLANRLAAHLGERWKINGLEIGCGHGHVAAILASEIGGAWSGMDISVAALQRAEQMYPTLYFVHGDISLPGPHVVGPAYNVVIWSQMLWYVAEPWEKLRQAVHHSLRMLEFGGLFVIHQALLPPGSQKYAIETVNGFHGAVRAFIGFAELELLEARYRPDALAGLHDGLLIFRKISP